MIDFPHLECAHQRAKKIGFTVAGTQRYKCLNCGKKFTDSTRRLAGMRIGMDRAAQALGMICEGMSISAASRLTNTDPHTLIDLLLVTGERCKRFLDQTLVGLSVSDVQCDEIWQFIYCKRRTATKLESVGHGGRCGDSYCFTAVERTSKLLITWHFGRRFLSDTVEFCRKLRRATSGHFHLSTDGYQPYLQAVPRYFAGQIDYGMLVKSFARHTAEDARTYSPAQIVNAEKEVIMGNPDESRICTSHTERHNGTIRTFNKRMGRLTYAFSKKWDNHEMAMALEFAHYNFCHKHRTLYIKGQGARTPAMAAGLTDHVWTMAELLEKLGPT